MIYTNPMVDVAFYAFYTLFFIAGTFIGSFLNVVSDRVVNKKSIFFGRSECDGCSKRLSARDLVPLISYILSRGKCSYCSKKLSWYYPLSEILTGLTFVGIAHLIRLFVNTQSIFVWLMFVYFVIVACFYIILLLTDLKFRLLPNKITFSAIGFVFFFLLFNLAITAYTSYVQLQADPFGTYLLESGFWKTQMLVMVQGFGFTVASALIIGLFFFGLTKIKDGRAMGGGDVKLAVIIGLFNGFPYNVLAIFLGFFLGAIISVGLIIVKRKGMKDTVPFGPFLILGSVISLIWGPALLAWYFSFF
jgi:leader peptidase (prepilin peptidase) / N-methyltransferase